MSKDSVSDWDTTASANTDVGGIGIQGTNNPSNLDDAQRAMMAQIASYTRAGADLASASTLNLDSIDSLWLAVTGTTTVTAVTLTSGHVRMVRATGAFQITAGSSLIVNGSTSVNYTTTAGDLLYFQGYGSSVVRVWLVGSAAGTPVMTSPVSYTPTTTGLGTLSNVNVRSWRNGAALEVLARFTTGTVTGSEARLYLGFNGTDSNVTVASLGNTMYVGGGVLNANSANQTVVLAASGNTYVNFGLQGSGAAGLTAGTGSAVFISSTTYAFRFSVPIAGW